MHIKELKLLIQQEKDKSSAMLDRYNSEIREHIAEHGEKTCDYLVGRRENVAYYQGFWNALNTIDRNIED